MIKTAIKTGTLMLLGLAALGTLPAADAPPPDQQLAAAILAAPEERRAEAGVLGYNQAGIVVTLREAKNDLICLADNPQDDSFSVACYHKDLEPFMARGRELQEQGVTGKERHAQRNKEVEEGKVVMPREARMLYVLTGKGFDPAAGEIKEAYLRWVVYVPFATPESTGLSTDPAPGKPWLMNGGTPGAHIMISPPK
jgi:hypothetical protein